MRKKRIAILLLCLLLCACLPTPEQEYIVNKGDDTLAQKLKDGGEAGANGNGAALGPQTFSDHWDLEETAVANRFSVMADAEITQRTDGFYPVYRTRQCFFTKSTVAGYLSKLLDRPVAERDAAKTKEDWGKELQAYLDRVAERERSEQEDPDADRDEMGYTPEEDEAMTDFYMEQIQNAPDEREAREIAGFSDLNMNGRSVLELESGEHVFVEAFAERFMLCRNSDTDGYVLFEYDVDPEEPIGKLWHEVTADRTQAEKVLNDTLARMEISGFAIASAYRANLLAVYTAGDEYLTNGWAFTLRRDYGGYPIPEGPIKSSSDLNYGEGGEFAVNRHINPEEIVVLVDENGLQYLSYSNPKEIVGIENPNVALLPLETIEACVQQYLKYFNVERRQGREKTWQIRADVWRMMLTPYTIYVKNAADYYEMPCWVVYYDVRRSMRGVAEEDPGIIEKNRHAYYRMHECLIINAVDGSIIHTSLDY